jgi:hypothetical protein
MIPLAFTLRVPGRDDITGTDVHSTTFQFHGLLRFEGTIVRLEWTGTAAIDEVTGLEVRSRTVTLPEEGLEVAVADLRRAEARGGWWRPRLELAARHIDTLRSVPGEERGEVRLWVARRDRHAARHLATVLTAAIAAPALANTERHTAVPRTKPRTDKDPPQ